MSGLTVVILNCVALCSGMCAQHIPWRAFEALTKAQEKVKFILEVVGPNALQRVATPMLLASIATRIAATKIEHTPAYDSYVLIIHVLRAAWIPRGHSCAPCACLHGSLPHQSKRRKRPCRAR